MIGRLRERGRPDGTRDVWSANISGLWTENFTAWVLGSCAGDDQEIRYQTGGTECSTVPKFNISHSLSTYFPCKAGVVSAIVSIIVRQSVH